MTWSPPEQLNMHLDTNVFSGWLLNQYFKRREKWLNAWTSLFP
jgi:hypothetical protein